MPPPLPREHGSWFMLLVPCTAGLAVAGRLNLSGLLFLLVATAFFLGRQPLILLAKESRGRQPAPAATATSWRFWLLVWGAASGLGLAVLLFHYRRLALLPVSALGLALLLYEVWRWRHSPRPDLRTEILAAVGLASGAAGAYVAAAGAFEQRAAMAWTLNALYFLAAVFYVNLMLTWLKHDPRTARERWQVGAPTLWAHALAAAVATLLALLGLTPALVPVAFLPSLAKAGWQVWRGGRETNFKRLGLVEAAHSLVFVVLLVAAYK